MLAHRGLGKLHWWHAITLWRMAEGSHDTHLAWGPSAIGMNSWIGSQICTRSPVGSTTLHCPGGLPGETVPNIPSATRHAVLINTATTLCNSVVPAARTNLPAMWFMVYSVTGGLVGTMGAKQTI